MLFNSLQFLIFLPVVLLVYYVLPQKVRYLWLLAASYYFYMCWNARYALLILFSTGATYACGLALDRTPHDRAALRRLWVTATLAVNLGVLFFFKYFGFAFANLSRLFALAGIALNAPQFDVLLPVGISFYTFQALGYILDVWRGDIRAEKNFFRYALFVSFFPQLVAGPIERSQNLLTQLAAPAKFSFESCRDGVLLMLWGFFLKIVVADRAAVFVNTVFNTPGTYEGWYYVVAALLFAVQIYCDFSGYSVIAMGSAKMLGVVLMENFDAPYLSQSTAEFWRRWHISLSSWFRDYLYIPLGGNRRGRMRKYLNVLITFTLSGLWHGAKWSFVGWGLLNGIYQVAGDVLKPVRAAAARRCGIHPERLGCRAVKTVFTFCLIDFSWILFRAASFREALDILRSIALVHNVWILFDGSLYTCGLEQKNFQLLLAAIAVLFAADLLKYRGVRVRDIVQRQDAWFQVLAVAGSVLAILVFGVYGQGFHAANFIYFQF